MEETFASVARIAALMIEIVAVVIVTYGCAEAFVKLVQIPFLRRVTHG